jgi:hypothetical protein
MTWLYDHTSRRSVVAGLCAGAVLVLGVHASVSSAAGSAPSWSLQALSLPTSLSATDVSAEDPTFLDLYQIGLTNIGTRPSNGIVTVTDTLPEGITVAGTPHGEQRDPGFWKCTIEEGVPREIVSCTTESVVSALTPAIELEIPVAVATGLAPGSTVTSVVTVSGGEAAATTLETATVIGQPPQTLEPLDFSFSRSGPAGLPANEAGEHPDAFTAAFKFPSALSYRTNHARGAALPVEHVKQIVTELPAGVVGNPKAAATCTLAELTNAAEETEGASLCPPNSRVGLLVLTESDNTYSNLVIYNMTSERGYAAEFGVYLPILQHAIILYGTLVGQGADAHVQVVSAPQGNFLNILAVSLTFFGNPGVIDGVTPLDSSVPFATNPANCAAPGFTTTMYADTWEKPGRTFSNGTPDLSDVKNWKKAVSPSPAVTGCENLQFHPSLALAPEPGHSNADEPAGYEARLQVPQTEGASAHATPPLKRTVVTLPAGVAISPAAANGLVGCQEAGSEGIEVESPGAGHCPSASTIGTAEVETPLLHEPLTGGVYVAQPTCGGPIEPACTEERAERGELFAIYLEAGSENAGVHLKLRGTVEVGGTGRHSQEVGLVPGQIRTTFAETPQQPFSELKLHFNGGPRAALANPQTCGSFTTAAELEPWSHQPAPGEASGTPNTTATPSFAIGGCESRFAPAFTAGTVNPQAGAFSPFTLTFSRQDREQDLSGLTVNMPSGLLGKIAGIPQCPEDQANAGTCSADSRLGTATAAAGSGSSPLWQSGPVYLTGPYNGAPFGLSVVVPAKAGPFNLGNIVVRAAIYIDPNTAAVTVVSNPLPQMIDGVPLRLKTVNVTVDREGFFFNPTSCEPARINATITSAQAASARVSSRFQVANCASLAFKPQFTASTSAKTSKANGASLHVKIAYPNEPQGSEANIAKVALTIPAILPTRLTTIQKACTEAQFNANPAGCPAASVIATAIVHTPVLKSPLTGPAYFVSHGGAAFPDVEMILQGEGVTLIVDGKTQIKKGVTFSRFETVPDAPFSSFEFIAPQGPFSIFTANGNLCASEVKMPTTLTAQNGAVLTQSTPVEVQGCPNGLRILSHSIRKRTLTIKVIVPGAGKLTASGKGLSTSSKSSKGRSTLTLTIKAKKGGKLKTKVKLSFAPTKGHKLAATVAARFKR